MNLQGTETSTPPAYRPRKLGGSKVGRTTRRTRTQVAGIRYEWVNRKICGPILRVVATWRDEYGVPRHTTFSVQRHGLEGALDRAIKARMSCGAPRPDRAALLQQLRIEFETRQQARTA